ncbi:hypothetical protein PQX77_010547 [Marasmius sp. AFHP31]|nr:hypothetical protein PQX77_010547 [Marasmius sp. AFHP31]
MSIIFGYCVAYRPTGWPWKITWLNVTQVCRQWRTVALNAASIWSRIDFTHPGLAREMIRRSKAAPLDVVVMHPILSPRVVDGLTDALSHVGRIRSLVVHSTHLAPDSNTLFANLDKPAPLLHTLDITGRSNLTFPNNMFAGDAPQLRKLKINGFHFPWSTSLLKNLTTLILLEPHDEPLVSHCPQCPTTKQLLEALREMPGLSVLELINSLPLYTSEKPAAPTSVVDLPKLTRLRLSGTLRNCDHLLQNISFPASAAVHLTCKSFLLPPQGDRHAIALFHTLSQIYSASTDSEQFFKWLSIETTFPPLSVKANTHEPKEPLLWQDTDGGSFVSTLHLQVDLYEFTGPMQALFRSVVQALPLGQLETLNLGLSSDDNTCSAKDVVDLFGGLNKVKTILLKQRDIYSFVEALGPPTHNSDCGFDQTPTPSPSTPGGVKKPRMTLPALETIKLADVDFGEDSSRVEALIELLAFRRTHGRRVDSLVLRDCIRIYEEGVRKLSNAVTVDWDGLERSNSEDEDEEDEDEDEDDGYYDEDAYADGPDDLNYDYGYDVPFYFSPMYDVHDLEDMSADWEDELVFGGAWH